MNVKGFLLRMVWASNLALNDEREDLFYEKPTVGDARRSAIVREGAIDCLRAIMRHPRIRFAFYSAKKASNIEVGIKKLFA